MPDTPGNKRPRLSVQPGWASAAPAGSTTCVYLVGAGPGDPELMTVRAARLLEIADAVFSDGLVPQAILDRAGPTAELIAVGHRSGGSKPAVGPVALEMADRAARGDLVVRLKGGDPFLFGRGAEEATALLEAGVAFEVIPGVTSALAGAAAAGIPRAQPGRARPVPIVAGHESDGEPERGRWDTLAVASDTLVVLMGVSRLKQLAARIIAAGRSAETPAAVVMAATRPEPQEVGAG